MEIKRNILFEKWIVYHIILAGPKIILWITLVTSRPSCFNVYVRSFITTEFNASNCKTVLIAVIFVSCCTSVFIGSKVTKKMVHSPMEIMQKAFPLFF